VRRITDFCIWIYVFGCKLSLFRLCDSDFGITPVDDITIGITCTVFCFHIALISFATSRYFSFFSVIILARLCVFGTALSIKKVLFVVLFVKVMSGRFIIIIIITTTIAIVALDSAGWLNLKFLEEERLGSAGYYNKALCTIPLPLTTGLWFVIAQNLSLPLRFSDWNFICVCELLFVLPPLPHIVLLSVITLILSDERYVLWFLRLHTPPPSHILSHCVPQTAFSHILSVCTTLLSETNFRTPLNNS
jgi:hypothetical protein